MRLFRLLHMITVYLWEYSGPVVMPIALMGLIVLLFKWYERKYLSSRSNQISDEVIQFCNIEQFKRQRAFEASQEDNTDEITEDADAHLDSKSTPRQAEQFAAASKVKSCKSYSNGGGECYENLDKHVIYSKEKFDSASTSIEEISNNCKESVVLNNIPSKLCNLDAVGKSERNWHDIEREHCNIPVIESNSSNITTNLDDCEDSNSVVIKTSEVVSSLDPKVGNGDEIIGLNNNISEDIMDLAQIKEKAINFADDNSDVKSGVLNEKLLNQGDELQKDSRLSEESEKENEDHQYDSDCSSEEACSDDDDEIISYDLEAAANEDDDGNDQGSSQDEKAVSYTINLSSNIKEDSLDLSENSEDATTPKLLDHSAEGTPLKSCLKEGSVSFHAEKESQELTPSRVQFGEIRVTEVEGLGSCAGEITPAHLWPKITSFDDSSSSDADD